MRIPARGRVHKWASRGQVQAQLGTATGDFDRPYLQTVCAGFCLSQRHLHHRMGVDQHQHWKVFTQILIGETMTSDSECFVVNLSHFSATMSYIFGASESNQVPPATRELGCRNDSNTTEEIF